MAHHRRFHRARHHAGKAAAGAKGTAIGVAAGAATAVVGGYAQSAIPFLATAGWWAMPAALAIVGHFLKRKNPTIGGAMIGIAGYQAYANYVQSHATGATAKGFESGSFVDAGMFVDAGAVNSTRYMDDPMTTASMGTASGRNAGMLMNHEVMGVGDAGILIDAQGLEPG
jgi:hypothetical protein